jgi:hypothetical protein
MSKQHPDVQQEVFSLRDFFAGCALAGFVSAGIKVEAVRCYQMADILMKHKGRVK